jgi:hypothetical protein
MVNVDRCTVCVTTNELGDIDPLKVPIRRLPGDVLLEIFVFYVDGNERIEAWYTLVHVCRRWRYVVFESPRRLNLRLLCTYSTPVRETLGAWPTLPIIIRKSVDPTSLLAGADNILAALEHHDRVCHIDLWGVPSSLLERLATVTKEPFPALTYLELWSNDESVPVLPDSFLGASSPRLRTLYLIGIPFPALPKLLLSTKDLVNLDLSDTPDSGYISPEAMVNCLSTLPRLESLELGFRSPRSRPNANRRPPPRKRAALPAFTWFQFKGVSEYLEDFVARIDAPLLHTVRITLFNQLIFNISQLPRFICRAEKFQAFTEAVVVLYNQSVKVTLYPQTGKGDRAMLALAISCSESDWQLSSLEQVCRSSLPLLFGLERLDIHEDKYWGPHWRDDMESAQWLALFHPFRAVKDLYLSEQLALRVAPALQELGRGRTAGVLPVLHNLFLEGLQQSGTVREAIGKFVAARQLSDRPTVTVNRWKRR